ncbi:MAG: hypothetical protein NVSMB27_08650 [Ktedonobacteraceae bacterium]
MTNNTPNDRKKASSSLDKEFREMNKTLDAIDKEMLRLKKERLQKEKLQKNKNSILTQMVKVMRDQGASEQSMNKALPGLVIFAKFCDKWLADGNGKATATDTSKNPQPSPTSPTSTSDLDEEVLGLFLSEVKTQEVSWLWSDRVPLGKITILDGDPGMGKSLLAIHLAACVSTGHPLPDGTPCQQGAVIFIAPEDGAADTLRPRLEAAGGNSSHVLLLNTVEDLDMKKKQLADRPFSLSQDLEQLEKAIQRTRAVLVILDPLMAVLGHSIDSSRDQDIRAVFTPLAQLAERTGCAILIIRHLNKGISDNALYRGAGSIGIIAAARIGLLVAQHPYEEHRRILATTKNNLSSKASNLSYQVIANQSGIPYIEWLGENNYTLSTLLDSGTNLSLERRKILQILQEASGPLGPQEIAELTGQKYSSVRLTLSRMHDAGEITRQCRGQYTALQHPSLLQKNTK